MEQTQTAQIYVWFLAVFAKLRKATISHVMPICLSVCPSVRTKNSAPNRLIFMEFNF